MKPGRIAVSVRITGLIAVILLQTYWFLQPVPAAAKVLAAAFVLLSIARPSSGLLVFAGLSPLSTVIASLCGGGAGLGSQLLEQLALGVGAGVLLRRNSIEGRTRIGAPALLLAVVALASAVGTLPAAAAPVARSLWDGPLLHQLAIRQTGIGSSVWAPLFAALVIAECGFLAWAVERTVRTEPELATRLLFIALIGHAGAAMVNVLALLGGAIRAGEVLEALPRLLLRVRYSRQMDWNAAASAFLLAGVAGMGLISKPWRRTVSVAFLLALVALGEWITGSRIAIAMSAGAVLVMIGWQVRKASRRVQLMVAGVTLAAGLAGSVVVVNSISRNDPLSDSVKYRAVMFGAGVELFKQAPVFGIGITKFHGASVPFVEPFLRSLGAGPGENAHNNFLQVLAEQGLVGLAALLAWLAVILVNGVRRQIAKPELARGALLLAIVACIGTWLTGHPLLVPEFALVFWLYCGILTGLMPVVPTARPRWAVGLLAAVVLATAPLRAYSLRNAAELEHLGFGVSSLWQHDDSQRYREAGADFALYLPASGRPVELPFRLAPGALGPLLLEIRIRGKLVDRIPVGDAAWHATAIAVSQGPRRFELVDFAVRSPTPGTELPGVLLRVGKPALR